MNFFNPPPFDDLVDASRTSDRSHRVPLFDIPAAVATPPLLLALTLDTLIAVTHIEAYNDGAVITLVVGIREGATEARTELLPMCGIRSDGTPWPRDTLWFGVEFADGSKAINVEWPRGRREYNTGSPEPHLELVGGRGLSHQYELAYWLHPLPPHGPLRLVCEWPARAIPETSLLIEAQALRDASAHSLRLWETT